jgi:hypothetical protein
MESREYERGRSLRNIHDEKSIYISTAHDSSLLVFVKGCTTRISWLIASKLIRGKEIFQTPRDSTITGHLLKGRTCAGSGCSRSSGHPDPRETVVDMTLAL